MFRCRYPVAFVLGIATFLLPVFTNAAEGELEEIIVTARQQAETLQDVPVTITAMTEEDLDRYAINTLVEASKMVPNMVIAQGDAGNGATLRLRGIGSSSISAAFDHSVAINLDGVVVNRGRFVHNSYLDMAQLEILKGPQSLYFGKSATAGVASITTKDPGDEFEFEISAGIETEYDGSMYEMIVSGPITDTFGARLAVGGSRNDELFENYSAENDPVFGAIAGTDKWYGDESLNTRLTLVWEPTDNFKARLKYSYSEYDNDGAGTAWTEAICPEGTNQPTALPDPTFALVALQGVDDCKLNGNTAKVNILPELTAGLPYGFDDGKPGLEQETDFLSLQMDWSFSENYTLTSVTGMVDLKHWELDEYSGGVGVFSGLHHNHYESTSQEFRLASHYDGALNFQLGLYFQEVEQRFDAHLNAFNLGLYFGPDPFTGNAYDFNKDHYTDTDVWSSFLALYWNLNDRTEITIGARYTDEEKDGYIRIPYMHAFAEFFGFSAPELITGLEFEDDNTSPEFAINYYINDDVSVFFAYKEGFKSGGIDNSALPNASLNPAVNGGDYSFLVYDSEEADGFDLGLKGDFLNSNLRFNATLFSYEYSDLQVQLFDSTIIQYSTFNASALETEGVEFDLLWQTNVEGLTIRSAWAWTDTTYSDDFITDLGENLKGKEPTASPEIAGFIGLTYDAELGNNWRYSFSVDARYSDEYVISSTLDPFTQDDFWLWDAAISVYSSDGRHQFNLIGRNIGDEIWAIDGGAIPGRCANATAGIPDLTAITCNDTGANSLDQAFSTQLGRTVTFQYRYTL